MADFWLLDKTVVHKLFKVLAPRYENFDSAVTKMWRAPREYPSVDVHKRFRQRSILELIGHPYPPVVPDQTYRNRSLIHNVLLDAARRDFNEEKARKEAEHKETVTKEPVEKIIEQKE